MAVLTAFREKTNIDWTLIASDTNSGKVFRQWKRGVEAASGDLVRFSGFIERLAGVFARHPDVSFAFCDSVAIDRDSQVIYEGYQGYYDTVEPGCFSEDRVWAGREFLSKYLAVKNVILNASSVIWRRDVLFDAFAGVGADLFDYRVAGYWPLYVEAANSPGSVAFCATPLNVHRRHARSVRARWTSGGTMRKSAVSNAAARYLGADAELAAKIDAYRKEIREYPHRRGRGIASYKKCS